MRPSALPLQRPAARRPPGCCFALPSSQWPSHLVLGCCAELHLLGLHAWAAVNEPNRPPVSRADWTQCPFAHPSEKAKRRDPRRYEYSGTACPDFRKARTQRCLRNRLWRQTCCQ